MELITLEEVRHKKPDHTRPINKMSPREILEEWLFLSSGGACERDAHKGVCVGFPADITARMKALQEHVCTSLASVKK